MGEDHKKWAEEIKMMYDIQFLNVDQIQELWESYSDMMAAGWMSHENLKRQTVVNILKDQFSYIKI